MNLQWQVTLDGKRNTVSSVEKQSKLFPAIVARFDNQKFYAGLTLGGGHYMLEIDDDVPRERAMIVKIFKIKPALTPLRLIQKSCWGNHLISMRALKHGMTAVTGWKTNIQPFLAITPIVGLRTAR